MIESIEAMIIEYSRTPSSTVRNIKNERKNSTIAKTTNIDEYISAVLSYPDSEDEDEPEYDEPVDEREDEQEGSEQEGSEQEGGDVYDEE